MAQRLKKKLDNMGVDPSNSKLNENFCLIGTPLPSLASTKDANEFVPVWKQEVRDEKGRRRLHGAFTGGFSAGYFNTVGSKEGWAPATFKSSRTNRASQKAARPEDFMDEEDLAELRDSQKLVDTTEPSSSFAPPQDTSDIASALQSLTLPTSDSPGAKLLRKMGWKPGQGIGPRISYERRRQQDVEAGVVKGDAPVDAEASKHLFAPRDTPVLLFRPKENAHGLGHVGPVRLGGEGNVQEKAGPNISAGFGLGALNDADDDDIDVYDPGATSSRTTRMAYDELDDTDADGHSRRRPLTLSNQSRSQAPSQTAGRVVGGPAGKFNDGRLVLSGFALSETPVGQDEWFPLPKVPKGWTPDPKRVWAKFSAEGQDENKPAEPEQSGWKKAPTAEERGAQLGEPALPQAKKSVFDYLSQKDRDRLQNFRKDPSSFTPAAPPPKPTVKPKIAPTTAPTAKAALLGFQPFTSDPLRQARYTAYLQYHASPIPLSEGQTPPGLGLLPDQNAEQFNKEMEDYAKAAAIFKPVSGAMAGRFVGASSGSVIVGGGPSVGEGGLYQPTFDKKEEDPGQNEIPIEEQDPKKNAARHGMYGPLTHEVQPWYPHRLLCKRFGVRDPHPDGPPTAAPKTWEEQVGVAPTAPPTVDLADVEMRPLDSEGGGKEAEADEDLGPRDLSNVGLGEDPHQGRDTLTYVRPSMDVFKAIFASDEEGSEDEDGQEQEAKMVDRGNEPVSALDAALRPAASGADVTGPVDIATFRPVFNVKSKPRDKDKEKKKDKKKDKSKRAVLSFDVDEGADAEDAPETTKSKSKPKRREREKDKPADRASKKARTEDEEEGDWVEKPPPPASALESAHVGPSSNPDMAGGSLSAEPSGGEAGGALGSTRVRKRAIDFM
ncbi:G patch domain-containing protein 1 [Ceratobasidium sp. AG-Ba]|nr:G patch domain-containing protein 1 [Ceratobasidium sp. AG-Ba]